jgi:hypothetical protein
MNSSFKNNNKYNNNMINKKINPHKILKNGYELDGFIDDDEEEINDEDHIKAKQYLKRIKKKLSRGRGENDYFDDKDDIQVSNFDTIQKEEEKTKIIGEKEDEEEKKKERELKKKKHKYNDDDDEEDDDDYFL